MPGVKAKPPVENLKAYVAPLEGRRGKLRLDFNENTVGPSPAVLDAIRALGPEDYATYPEYGPLTAEYAAYVGVQPDQVGMFNGVDAAIHSIFDAFGREGEVFLTAAPTFGYYGPCAAQQGMREVQVPYTEEFRYPLEQVRERLVSSREQSPQILFICNPNNPTGTVVSPKDIFDLAASSPDTLVVVDELYVDFTQVTVLPQSLEYTNIVVLRSLSKTHGLAALRLGFAIGERGIVDRLSRVTGPYDVNMFAVVAGRAALKDPGYVANYVAQVEEAKRWAIAQLEQRGVRFFAEGGNYMLVWPKSSVSSVVEALDERGIKVRQMSHPALAGCFRLSIGTRTQMGRFFAVFDEIASH